MEQPPRRRREQDTFRVRPDDTQRSVNDPYLADDEMSRNPITQGVEAARETLSDTVDSMGTIVGGIIEDLQGIIRGEVQLAKTEVKEEATRMGAGAGMLAGAAVFGLIGFHFLMLALMVLLHNYMRWIFAAGTVSLILLVIAGILAMIGKNRIDRANLVPQKTIDSVKEDQEWAKRQMNSVKK